MTNKDPRYHCAPPPGHDDVWVAGWFPAKPVILSLWKFDPTMPLTGLALRLLAVSNAWRHE